MRKQIGITRVILVAFLLFPLSAVLPTAATAQQTTSYDEVVFGFTLRGLGSYNISVAIRKDRVYLPVMELFNLFEIYYTIQGQNILKGTYLSSAYPMTIDPVKRVITVGDKRYELKDDEVFKGDMDIYLSRERFEEIFGIKTTVNFNRLQINAETDKELPILARRRIEQERLGMSGGPLVPTRYPLRYDLKRSLLGGALLDYNISTSLNRFSSGGTSYTLTGGGEVAGGDIQGSLIGGTGQAADVSDLRWRYVVRDNDYFSAFSAGQISTGSDFIPKVTGISLSNEPVEPRVMFDNYVVDGYTDPESEVELYLNDRLVSFQKANATGYYRFQIPLTYGTARITIKTFSKYGDINVSQKQIQVPFTFVPKGILSYNLNAGKIDKNFVTTDNGFFGNADFLYGATNWLSLKGGVEKSSNTGLQSAIYDLGFSSRLFSQYIVDADFAPNSYYTADASALFASNAGFALQYTKYVLTDTVVGISPQANASFSVFVPLDFLTLGSSVRLSENYTSTATNKSLSPRFDFATLLGGLQLLLSYQEVRIGPDVHPLDLGGHGLISTTAMYSLPRTSVLPGFLQGFLLRGQAAYDLHTKGLQEMSLQVSKTFLQIFQFNFGLDRNFVGHSTSLQAGLIMDLDVTRTSSVVNASGEDVVQRHAIYGSIGLDQNTSRPFLSNRQEVDKGGLDVLLFVDNNNDGVYDAGDELIPAKGVKLDGMGKTVVEKDSVIRITQLQNYFRYNLQVDRQQIDPNLVPEIDKFSFIVEPNQIRRIEIPFYRGGTVAGNAYWDDEGIRTPLSGARVIMRSMTGSGGDTLRTFADGGFYSMNVAPGTYSLTVDSSQLKFLGAIQKGGPLSVTVHRSRQGDIIDTLEIVVGKPDSVTKATTDGIVQQLPSDSADTSARIQIEEQQVDSLPKMVRTTKTDSVSRPVVRSQRADSVAIVPDSTAMDAAYEHAKKAFSAKQYTKAAVEFQKLLRGNVPEDLAIRCHYWIGESKYAARQYNQALKEFRKVLTYRITEKTGDAQFMIGQCYERLGNKKKAAEAFQKVVKEFPMNDNVQRAREALDDIQKSL